MPCARPPRSQAWLVFRSGRRTGDAPDPELVPDRNDSARGDIELQEILRWPAAVHAVVRRRVNHISAVLAPVAAAR